MKAYIGPMTTNEDYSTNKSVVDIEVHDYDVFDVDVTIATIALPLLQKLKQVRQERIGCYPDEVVKVNQEDQWLLDELIWVMNEIVEGCPGSSQFFDESEVDPNTDLMTQVNAIKVDITGYDAYQDRITNALKLFGENFRSLWS